MHILMIAAENGALPGGKVGGVADVIRDVPLALTRAGHRASVITPGYQRLSRLPGAQLLTTLAVEFAGGLEQVALYRVDVPDEHGKVEHYVLEHSLFAACGPGHIYCHDDWGPFSTDAHKFALFCSAVCHALDIGELELPDVLHLHDWHSAPVLFLRQYRYPALRPIRCVYSIHNLSIQGVRPFTRNASSLDAWYSVQGYAWDELRDPHSPSCVNMMRMGINLADRVHVVSPTYAREIMQPSDPDHGFVGGEGLEEDLQRVAAQGRLAGILNGCEYPRKKARPVSSSAFIELANDCLLEWISGDSLISSAFFFARERLQAWAREDGQAQAREETAEKNRTPFVVASIGRLTQQKVGLLPLQVKPGVSTLEALLEGLGDNRYIMLGSGDRYFETLMTAVMARHPNFLFLRGYSDTLSEALYRHCDLFLMPSSFEPCGISQMLAMRAGKPCLVHQVGGLADTVKHNVNGLSFTGQSPLLQCQQLLRTFKRALRMQAEQPEQWQALGKAAARARFSWEDSVAEYLDKLYC